MSSTSTDKQEETAASTTTPIFGASSTFGAGAGFGGFSGLTTKKDADATDNGDEGENGGEEEEECAAEFKPVVQLDEVEVSTGEEEEEALFDVKCKLYRFDNDAGEWKERGVGQAKLLRHKENRRIRFIMRQDKTLKIRGNHVVIPGSKVQEHGGSEKAMVWSCVDFADEVQKPELFCIRFASQDRAQEFKKAYEDAADMNADVLGIPEESEEGPEEEKESEKEVSAAADELAAKASVSKEEENKD